MRAGSMTPIPAVVALVAALATATAIRADDPAPPAALPEFGPEAREWLESDGSAAFGRWLEEAIQGRSDTPEWLAMFADILQGSRLGPEDGWFPLARAQTRFGWDATRSRYDADGDGSIARGEFPGSDPDFARLDRDHDGALTPRDFDFSAHALAASPGMMLYYLADGDGDGKVTREELNSLFDRADSDGLGFLSQDDLRALLPMPQPPRPSTTDGAAAPPQRPGPSKATLIRGLFAQEIGTLSPGPALDEAAPDFTLRTVEGDREVTLSELIGEKPVVLVFGNFTCGPFRSQGGNVEKLYERYKDRAHFLMIYVREAHPKDGWHIPDPAFDPEVNQPRTYDERRDLAQSCQQTLGFDIPFLVDTIDDAVGGTYSGMPSRLYLIDRDGKVAYKSGRGPFGFKPAELEQALIWLLTEERPRDEEVIGGGAGGQARVPLLDNDDAWARLPVEHGDGPAPTLPSWARALAHSLPATTARMLALDHTQRTCSPLDPLLRGSMRLVAADALGSVYGRAYAEADLRRAGMDDEAIRRLAAGDFTNTPDPERNALEFARTLTLQADQVTDAQVARLIADYGEEQVVAMVHLLAYANFQDRLLLALGVPVEPGGPLPPLAVRLDPEATPDVPPRTPPNGPAPSVPTHVDDPLWTALDLDDLRQRLEAQRSGPGRIRVPTWEEMLARLPEDYPRPKRPQRIKWSLIGMGYQPELTAAWLNTMSTFGQESKQDTVFEESLFWVVTRTIHCFY